MAWKRSDVRAMRRANAWADRTEQWAMAWERIQDRVAAWAEVTEVGGVPLAERLGITVHHSALPGDGAEPDGTEA
jgi:hypothetical protein